MKERAIVINPANVLIDISWKKFFISLSALSEVREWLLEDALKPFLKRLFKGEISEKSFFSAVKEVVELLGGQAIKGREIEKAFLSVVGSVREETLEDLKREEELFTALAHTTSPVLWKEINRKLKVKPDLTLLSFNIQFTEGEDLYYTFIFNTLSYHSVSKAIYVDAKPSNVEKAQENGLSAFTYVRGKRLRDYLEIAREL